MHLSKAIKEFPLRRISKLSMPTVKSLEDACKEFRTSETQFEEDRERISRILGAFGASGASQLSVRDLRYITGAIGSHAVIDEEMTSAILTEIDRRKDARLTRATFKALLASYASPSVRSVLRDFVGARRTHLGQDVQKFCAESEILSGDGHLANLAGRLSQANDASYFCISKGITSNILSTSYGHEFRLASIRSVLDNNGIDTAKHVLNWAFAGTGGTPTGDFYEACLSPFEERSAAPEVQKAVMSVLVREFGDPRISDWPRLSGSRGTERRERCLKTIRRWLSIEYLDLFIRIIEATAVDYQFAPRKRFWLRYFEKGVVSDLTLVLAGDASSVARKTRGQSVESEYMKWASLTAALPDQSVLLMRLGDLVIAEWSHSGAMRFWMADSKSAPKFHRNEYTASELRTGSMKVRTSSGYRDSIVHSPNGQWMTFARDAIEFHTNIRA